MRSDSIVVASPSFDEHLCLPERREDFSVEQLVSELRVQALAIAVLPRTARFDVERLNADASQPVAHRDGRELRAIVGTHVLRRAVSDKEIGEALEHVVGSELPGDDNG